MADLTPHDVVANLGRISRELGEKAAEVEALDHHATDLRHEYKRAWNRAFLTSEQSSDTKRKIEADVTTEQLSYRADMADQTLRAAKEALNILRDRLDVGRSLGAIMRMEWQGRD